MDKEQISWAAGLFEGEGCFTLTRGTTDGRTYQHPKAELNSTDQDVVERFSAIVGVGHVRKLTFDRRGEHYKPQWSWSIGGHQGVQQVVALLWPWLCERRRARAAEIPTAPRGYVALKEAA